MTAYGPSTVKRARRTNNELADLDGAIIAAVEQDKPVTLRGVFYRVMSAGAVDKTELGYRAVGRRLLALRREGRISYWDITDGTRWITKPRTYDGWEHALRAAAESYRQALWSTSPYALHLFTEKDAITGAIEPVTAMWDVPLGVTRGYSGETFAWRCAQSLHPRRVNVLAQLGDHDPSGVDGWQEFARRVTAFAPEAAITTTRLAVTPEQIEELNLPLRPTKTSDPRSRSWVGGSVEVDAIPAPMLRDLVENWIRSYVDEHQLAVALEAEESERDILRNLAGVS